MRPVIAAESEASEAEGQLTAKTVQALEEAGLFQLNTPRRFGGHEGSLQTLVDVGIELAEADGSVSWATTIMNGVTWVVSQFGDEALHDMFGSDPLAKFAGSMAPVSRAERVSGGYRISGRLGFATGSHHASWVMATLVGDGGLPGLAVVPASDFSIDHTWQVVGMRSTGSDTVVIDDAFVPDHRILWMPQLIERIPTFAQYATLVLAAPQIGMARAALRVVGEAAATKGVTYTVYEHRTDSQVFQALFGEAALKADTAYLHVMRAVEDITTAMEQGVPLAEPVVSRVHGDTATAVSSAVDAIGILVRLHGSGAYAEASPLQRIWRNANVGSSHAMAQPHVNYEIYGKTLLGVEPNITMYL